MPGKTREKTQQTIDRFRNRKRPTVQRDISLAESLDQESGLDPTAENPPTSQADSSGAGIIELLRAEIAQAPALAPTRNIRIEQQTLEGLELICREQKITIDNFLDSVFEICQADSKLMGKVVAMAQKKYKARKEIARKRRTLTELEK
jgi:hypothetical protein